MTRRRAALLVSAATALSVLPLTASPAEAALLPEVVPPALVSIPWLDGTRMRIGYRAGSALATSVQLTRTSPGQAPLVRQLPVDHTEFTETGLEIGRTYTYEVRAVGPGGVQSAPASRSAIATARPVFAVDGITSSGAASAPFRVRLTTEGSTARTRYVVFGYQLPPGRSTFNEPSDTRIPFVDGARGTSFVFGGPAGPGIAATTSVPGATYRFAGFAIDEYGNRTLGTASARAAVPLDQSRSALAGGAVTARRAGAYGGSAAVLPRAGASVTRTVRGEQLAVVGERCATCGAFDVLLDGKRAARVDSRSATRQVRQVLWARRLVIERSVAVTVRAVGTPGRPAVYADAFAGVRPAGRGRPDRFESLSRGSEVRSPNGRFRVAFQRDGNVVVGPVGGRPSFTTRTAGSIRATAPLFVGNFGFGTRCRLTVNSMGRVFYDAGTSCAPDPGPGGEFNQSTLVMQDDGNLVAYRYLTGRPFWSSRTGRL